MTRPLLHANVRLDATASGKTVYRHLLRASARHPDALVASYFATHWRSRAEHILNANLTERDLQSRLDSLRKIVRRLQRAADGVPDDFEWTLKQAYGVTGRARHRLSASFLDPLVLPLAEPIQAGNKRTIPPTFSPALVLLLESPTIRDNPVPTPILSLPPTLPAQGLPRDPELYIRPFLSAHLEAKRRWDYFREIINSRNGNWPSMRWPIVVRLQGKVDVDNGDPTRTLAALGIKWDAYVDGGREQVLNWIEYKAGKGQPLAFKSPKRGPITSESIAALAASQPDPIVPSPLDKPADKRSIQLATAGASTAQDVPLPNDHQTIYRRILSYLPIATVNLDKVDVARAWLTISLSPWSARGPALYHPVTVDDLGWTQKRRGFGKGKRSGQNEQPTETEKDDGAD